MGSTTEPKTSVCLVRCGKCPNCVKHAKQFEMAAKTIRNALTFIQNSNKWSECSSPVVGDHLAEEERAFQHCDVNDFPHTAEQVDKTVKKAGKQVIKDGMTDVYDKTAELTAVVN